MAKSVAFTASSSSRARPAGLETGREWRCAPGLRRGVLEIRGGIQRTDSGGRYAATFGQHDAGGAGAFFIDAKSKVWAILYYPLSNGRNFREIKRLLLAMQTTDTRKVATPVDWQPREKERVQSTNPSTRRVDWSLCF